MTGRLSVGCNLAWLQPGRVGGTETYAVRLLRALAGHAPDIELNLLAGPRALEALGESAAASECHVLSAFADRRPGRVVVERTELPRRLGRIGVDVEHHLGGTVPRRSARPTVVTIHDLQPLDDPLNFGPVKRRWLARAIPKAVDRADVVVTPSEWVADSVVERFALDPDRVRTVSVYAESGPSPVDPSPGLAAILGRGPVALYPAMTMAHKNHRMLFRAFSLAAERRPDLQLVCVGAVGRDHDGIASTGAALSPRIHLLGHVPTADLATLYEVAELLVFPSRYEGFGLPVLEAQAAGLPVIASSATALPEVAGDGARLLDPDDVDAWADAMAEPLGADERDRLVEAGRLNVGRYTPAATAAAQTGVYRLAVGVGGRA